MDQKIKHLEFIQGVVNRLSTNSFLLKGWTVVLVSALFALSAADSDRSFALLAYVPAVVFWGLDGYFLWQERLFRGLYNMVRAADADATDFSMDTSVVKGTVPGWFEATFSLTLIPFYGVLLVAIFIVMLLT